LPALPGRVGPPDDQKMEKKLDPRRNFSIPRAPSINYSRKVPPQMQGGNESG